MLQSFEAGNYSSCPSYHAKAVFCPLLPFCTVKVCGKLNMGKLRTQYAGGSPDSFLSLFLLFNFSSPQAPTLEHMNPLWLGAQQKSPQKGVGPGQLIVLNLQV